MNNANLEFLKNQVKYTGFGETFNVQLEENLKAGNPEFQLKMYEGYNVERREALLYFRKSEQSDMYFFNKYEAALIKDPNSERLAHTFYMDAKSTNNITMQEAFNLLEGRAVHKNLETKDELPYKAWIQFDLGAKDDRGNFKRRQFHENYGFDLKEAVAKLPIQEMGNTTRAERIMKALEKGNLVAVTFMDAGSESKRIISANPQFKSINIYDDQIKPILSEKQQQAIDAKKSESKSQDQAPEKQKGEKQDTPKKNSKVKNDSLLPKKRESNGKGMKV